MLINMEGSRADFGAEIGELREGRAKRPSLQFRSNYLAPMGIATVGAVAIGGGPVPLPVAQTVLVLLNR